MLVQHLKFISMVLEISKPKVNILVELLSGESFMDTIFLCVHPVEWDKLSHVLIGSLMSHMKFYPSGPSGILVMVNVSPCELEGHTSIEFRVLTLIEWLFHSFPSQSPLCTHGIKQYFTYYVLLAFPLKTVPLRIFLLTVKSWNHQIPWSSWTKHYLSIAQKWVSSVQCIWHGYELWWLEFCALATIIVSPHNPSCSESYFWVRVLSFQPHRLLQSSSVNWDC